MASARQKTMLEAGAAAPDIQLSGPDRSARSLLELAAKSPVMLAFFKVSCPTCQFTLPFLERIYREIDTSDLAIYTISQDDEEVTEEFNREFNITIPSFIDSERLGYPASDAFSISNVPSMFVVENGRISWASMGFDRKDLSRLAQRLGISLFRPGENVPEWKAG
jgi:peroxiredoxin